MKRISPSKLNFNVVFKEEPEGGFTVIVPVLPGCITYGKNLREAKKMAAEAITLYLEDIAAEGEKLPQNDQTYLGSVEVNIPSASSVHA